MIISETGMVAPSQEVTTDYARLLNWIIRMRAVGAPPDRSYFQYQMAKVPQWESLAIESLADIVDGVVQGLQDCGATSLVALSFPFYLIDGRTFAYEGEVTSEHVRDVLRGWAPYDYALIGVASVDGAPAISALATIVYDQVVVMAGPKAFLSRSVGDIDASRLEFARYAARSEERGGALSSISTAVSRYSDLPDWGAILFPE
jgi:hypothetical protein